MEQEISELQYRDDIHVIQANRLIRSKKDDLTLLEAKLIRLAIAQILKDDTDLRTYSCRVVDLAAFLGTTRQNIHKEMSKFSESLMRKVIKIEENDPPASRKKSPHWKIFHWVDSCEYKDGVITFKLSEELRPYLVGLNQLFTQYAYSEILTVPTANSISLFELIASYRNLRNKKGYARTYNGMELRDNEFVFTMEFLRQYFNCEKKYPLTADFIRRVIDLSVNAINRHTPGIYRISYEKIIQAHGRKIEALCFTVDVVGSELPEEVDCE